uniref:Uncharacterized protein n=1 Tax=Oryza brachyantha TaxID=4533 RepID=J3MGU2_ORYBR
MAWRHRGEKRDGSGGGTASHYSSLTHSSSGMELENLAQLCCALMVFGQLSDVLHFRRIIAYF